MPHLLRRSALLALGALSAISACDPRSPSPSPGADSIPGPTTPVAMAESVTAAPSGPLVRVGWRPFGVPAPDTADLGTGIVAVAIAMGDTTRRYPLEDTLVFRAEPRADSPVVGALIVERSDPLSWTFSAVVPSGVQPNLREYAYEEAGVPTDSTDATGRWVRGIIGFSSTRVPVRGWASLDSEHTRSLNWADRLAEHVSFFLDTATAKVYRTPSDAEAGRDGEPVPGERHEIDSLLERRGRLLRVRIRWPYEACSDPKEGTETRVVWIRYLDDRGRPLVFYPTRGC